MQPNQNPQQPQYQQAPQQPVQGIPGQQPIQGAPVPPQMAQPAQQPQQAAFKTNPNSTQNSLQIAEVRDGIVIMNDGSFRAVIACQSINFDLMSPEEREAVEYSYQGFLNSLYFPVQIFVRSQKVDMRPYIEKLDKIRSEHDNMLLALLMEDYIGYMDALAQQTNIMDKKFYIIIPFFKEGDLGKVTEASKGFFTGIFGKKEEQVTINEQDLEAAKSELRNRIQSVMAGLQQCSIPSVPLDTSELIELYYDAYNPDTATRQQITNFQNLTAPVTEKGQGQAAQPHLDREMDI